MDIKSILNVDLIGLVKGLLKIQKKLDISKLPSQGLFYNDDFVISIQRAKVEDIIEYEFNFVKDDIGIIIQKVKKVVERNVVLSSNYHFDDIKSIDVIYIFLEIVKFTKNHNIEIKYFDENDGKESVIEFGSETFNYFKLKPDLYSLYNKYEKCFEMNGYKYALPSIGVENSLTNYLIYKSSDKDAEKYNDYNFDFTFFLSHKRNLSFNEIDNLIQIFNFEIDFEESIKIKDILNKFLPIQKYSLIRDGKIIDINSKIDLQNIWK